MFRRTHLTENLEARRLLAAQVLGSSAVYATIQAAVDAAPNGGTVVVEPGTYAELVTIRRTMTVRGARSGVDARSSARGTGESIVKGTSTVDGVTSSFVISANNVTLDGFTVQGNTSTTRFGAGIVISPNIDGTRIANNIIEKNIAGLYLSNDSSNNAAVIEKNLFRDNNQIGQHSGRGIYTDGGYSGGNLTNVTIDNNAFIRNFGGMGSTKLEGAIDLHAQSTSRQTNFRITNNAFDDNGKALLAFNANNLTITGNVITATRDTRSGALRFEGNVNTVNIAGNLLYNNIARAIRIDNNAASGSNYDFAINGNNIYRNAIDTSAGVNHDGLAINADQYDGTLDAENNWWGDASGPGGDGPGSGDAVFANGNSVDYTPWEASPVANQQMPYFARPFGTGERIDMVYFDHGGQGVSYSDVEIANKGGQLRKREFVDIEASTDPGSGYDVGYVRAGEWLEYTIDVAQDGTYSFDFRVACALPSGGSFHLDVDDVPVAGAVNVPGTGSWQSWRTISKDSVALTAGRHVVRVGFDSTIAGSSVGNFSSFQINPQPQPPPPPPPPPTTDLPAPWVHGDIGVTGLAGSAAHAGGVYTVKGAGADIWGAADAFHYVYQQMIGDGEMVVRVASLDKGDLLAKAGIDIRASLDAAAVHAGVYLTPGNAVRFMSRATSGGSTARTVSTFTGAVTPMWLKLTRSGNSITASSSRDGLAWTVIGTQTLAMGQVVYVGMAVCSKNAGALLTATFDNVGVVT